MEAAHTLMAPAPTAVASMLAVRLEGVCMEGVRMEGVRMDMDMVTRSTTSIAAVLGAGVVVG